MTVEEILASGAVPTSRVAPILRRELLRHFDRLNDVAAGSLPRILAKWESVEKVDFNSADRVFCKLWCFDIWREELADVYRAVNLSGKGVPMPVKQDGPPPIPTTPCRNGHERGPGKVRLERTFWRCNLCHAAKNKRHREKAKSRG